MDSSDVKYTTAELTHKLNNQLSLIWGYAQLLERDETLTEAQRQRISKISETCQEMAEAIKKFKD
jgi:light-regulated signal transduction histidine kinase (bacteriophytochrome)